MFDSNSLWDKCSIIKRDFNDYVVFVKYKKKFYSFDFEIGKLFGMNFSNVVRFDNNYIEIIWKLLDEYNIKYIVYTGNIFRKYNDAGNVLDMEVGKRVVFRKNGNFYRCYDDDALIMTYLFDYRIVNGSVGFPQISMEKIKKRLDLYKISYVFKDNMKEVCDKTFEDNQYDVYWEKGKDRYDKMCIIDNISKKLINFSDDKVREIDKWIDSMAEIK